jgi:hypothetical protein
MRNFTNLILPIFLLAVSIQAKADSWIDPTWKRMLDSSDVIALVEYRSNGDFKASAKIEIIYKGQLNIGDEIWISGYSNRYGPIDKMKKGNKYLVFLNLNEPTERSLEYWNEEMQKDSKQKEYVEALKAQKAYYVWSPTSGDLKIKGETVQYNLIQSSYYHKQSFYPLKDFESFLSAYIDKNGIEIYQQKLISKIKTVNESDEKSQSLMQLYLLGYSSFLDEYSEYALIKNPLTKYALAQLMGNIKNENSRNVLITLLDDENSMVQGESVRQLKVESPEIVAPILLSKLKSSSGENFGPSNLMDPVMNTIDGGKTEIIKTLGELRYEPAIPDLLSLLETEDDYLFELVIEALKEIESKEYIPYINKHLDNKTHDLIFEISMMIVQDSLVECLPSFKNFISSCNRNRHPNYEYTISTCCGIGHFKDSTTEKFLLSDFEHFFTYKDTLNSSKQLFWTHKYFKTFAELETKEARPLLFKSIYDWFGINQDFGIYPQLFEIKKQAEDSLRVLFSNLFVDKKYELNYCIAYLSNTSGIILGKKPEIDYLIEVSTPKTENGEQYKANVASKLGLNKDNIYIRYGNGWYHYEKQRRFDNNLSSTPLIDYLSYAKSIPIREDVDFLKAIIDNNFITDEYYKKKVKETIMEIQVELEK